MSCLHNSSGLVAFPGYSHISIININFLNRPSKDPGFWLTSRHLGWVSRSLLWDAVSLGGNAWCLELRQQPGPVPAPSRLPPGHGRRAEPEERV